MARSTATLIAASTATPARLDESSVPTNSMSFGISASLRACAIDDVGEAVELLATQLPFVHVEERRDGLLRRPGEESRDDVLEGGAARALHRNRRGVHVPRPVLLVLELPLLLEDPQH